ncbi:LOW QUALITY PROTEIN: hypothetical protein HID58_095026, partial [Brassica napus]
CFYRLATLHVTYLLRPVFYSDDVLDEDAYVAAIEKIIERDYFPDISKLRDRLDWIQAVKTRDPIQIRDAQLKIIERRGKKANHHGGDTVGDKTQTPGSTFLRSFTPLDEFDGSKTPREKVQVVGADDGMWSVDGVDVVMSLDQRHTSEDNDSFSNILENEGNKNKRKKEKYGYLLEGGDAMLIEDAKRDRITDGYATEYVTRMEVYSEKNLLMYHPADRGECGELRPGERAVRLAVAGLTKEIVKATYTFSGEGRWIAGPREDGSVEILYTPIAGSSPCAAGRLRIVLWSRIRRRDGILGNGYSFVKTPSPAPGLDESAFIYKVGEIEGTTMRLVRFRGYALDIGGADGPHYKHSLRSCEGREGAHSLSRDASRRLRREVEQYVQEASVAAVSLSSEWKRESECEDAFARCSEFFRRAIRKSSSAVDESLRASYRGASLAL